MNDKEKAKLYDEAYKKVAIRFGSNVAYEIFPELKESEDERIRKEIIFYLRYQHSISENFEDIGKWIAWLEKQGEQNLIMAKSPQLREQKPTDKVEPKFHEGDWSVSNLDGKARQISEVHFDEHNSYYMVNGMPVDIEEFDRRHRLWTIQDAKDGDVLINKNYMGECPFIFKETKPSNIKIDMPNPLTVLGYCGIGGAGFTKGSGWGDTVNCTYYPATKEQRELLFQKIKEAGYEWDADKKELRKIEQKSAWSEEDEEMLDAVIADIRFTQKAHNHEVNQVVYEREIDWLKSIKDRYTWKPSDEQLEALESATENCAYSEYQDCLKELLKQLKKLRKE